MLEMLLNRQGESEQVRNELIGASLSHVLAAVPRQRKVLYRPLLKYLARGGVGTLEPKVREPSSTSYESW